MSNASSNGSFRFLLASHAATALGIRCRFSFLISASSTRLCALSACKAHASACSFARALSISPCSMQLIKKVSRSAVRESGTISKSCCDAPGDSFALLERGCTSSSDGDNKFDMIDDISDDFSDSLTGSALMLSLAMSDL